MLKITDRSSNDALSLRRRREAPLIVPLLNSSPLADMMVIFAALPIWWLLGVEQFIWTLLLTWTTVKILIVRGWRLDVNWTILLLGLFVVVHMVSSLFIVENYRYVTFVRNLSTYISALLTLVVVLNIAVTWQRILLILVATYCAVTCAALLGVAAIVGIFRPAFATPFGLLLPDWIRDTTYGGAVAAKVTGYVSWFLGLGAYFRVNSFFLFPTHFAATLALSLVVGIFLFSIAKRRFYRLLVAVSLASIAISLVYTTGRGAILSLVAGAVYFWLRGGARNSSFIVALVALLLVFVSGTLAALVVFNDADFIGGATASVLYARGPGSFLDRSYVYIETIRGFLERPVFGWGTERDVANLPYPAGSHSYYLGILYKQGIVGLLTFLGLWLALWKESRPIARQFTLDPTASSRFLDYGRWMIVIAVLNSVTDVLDLDAVTMAIMWLYFGLLLAARQVALNEAARHAAAADRRQLL